MNPISESYKLYREAWKDSANSKRLLAEAITVVKQAYESGNREHLLINNYIALLLDTQQYPTAFELLEENKPESSEFCQNYAIAIANDRYNINEIRKWNKLASDYQRNENAIVAYVDWQGF